MVVNSDGTMFYLDFSIDVNNSTIYEYLILYVLLFVCTYHSRRDMVHTCCMALLIFSCAYTIGSLISSHRASGSPAARTFTPFSPKRGVLHVPRLPTFRQILHMQRVHVHMSMCAYILM